jgi:hypothetical protein
MALITVRALDPVTNDPLQGNSQNNFVSDLEAVIQIIRTRLLLFQGEWFLDLFDGLPMFQSILGASGSQRNIQIVINIISQRISGTPFVTGINSITATYKNRNFTFSARVETAFGTVFVGNMLGSTANLSITSS